MLAKGKNSSSPLNSAATSNVPPCRGSLSELAPPKRKMTNRMPNGASAVASRLPLPLVLALIIATTVSKITAAKANACQFKLPRFFKLPSCYLGISYCISQDQIEKPTVSGGCKSISSQKVLEVARQFSGRHSA